MSDDSETIRQLRRRLEKELLSNQPLPEFLEVDDSEVTDDVLRRAAKVRDTVLRGDLEAVRRVMAENQRDAVLHRKAGEPDERIEELEEAEERVRRRIEKNRKEDDDAERDGSRDEDTE